MNTCGLRSVNGNHELCTCTMMRWPAPERVIDVGHREINLLRLTRHERLGFLQAVAKFSPERLPAHELLVT